MEIQKVPGLDFEELGLGSGIVIPLKFKVPLFAKYDGVSCPKMYLRSYVRKIQPHSADKDLWVHFFQDSLSGTQLDWFYQLERPTSTTRKNFPQLSINNTSITQIWRLPVLNFRVWLWLQMRVSKITRKNGDI